MKVCQLLCLLPLAFAISPESVPRVRLSDGGSMPSIALGTWLGISAQGPRVQPKGDEVEKAVAWAVDAGYRHVDTAHIYKVEEQVGRALASKLQDHTVRRQDLFVTSKLWNDQHAEDAVVPALRETLRKLQLQYLDLYLIHWPIATYSNLTYQNVDYVETWRGMQKAKQLGLTKSIGLSNFNIAQIDRVLAIGGDKPAALQVEVNLNLQQPSLLEHARKHDMVVMGYTPFGSLFPSKASSEAPPPRVDDPELVKMAAKYNKTVPQVALRYIYELGVVPLPKSITKSRIEQNIDIFDFQLDEADKQLLKSYDKNFRTITIDLFKDSPYYPFDDVKKANN